MKTHDPVSVEILLHDGNGTYSELSSTNPLPGTSSGGSGSPTAYGDPITSQIVSVTNVAATVAAKDLTRTRIDFFNVSDTEITIAPVTSGLVAGQGLLLEPKPPQLAVPAAPTATGITTSGTLASGTPYVYRVTALDGRGETLAGAESTAVTLGSAGSVVLSWPAVPAASSYKVYGRTVGAEQYLATVTTPNYTDNGGATPSGPLPTVNTTGMPAQTVQPVTFYSNCAWQAVHGVTGSKNLYIITWGS